MKRVFFFLPAEPFGICWLQKYLVKEKEKKGFLQMREGGAMSESQDSDSQPFLSLTVVLNGNRVRNPTALQPLPGMSALHGDT